MLKRFFFLLPVLCMLFSSAQGMTAQHAFSSRENLLPLVPQDYALTDFDIQPRNILLLLESPSGSRRLRVLEYDDQRCINSFTTDVLPQGAGLDTAHPGDDALQIEWHEGEALYCAQFSRCTDGRWALSWASDDTGVFAAFHAAFNSIREAPAYSADARAYYGAHPWNNLSEVDFTDFPHTLEDALAMLDQRASAVVSNPNPADRLHLRTGPKKSDASCGKFYNGTPVQVLEVRGDWAHVRIGLDSNLDGWMMKKYLAFGSDGNNIEPAFPQLYPIEDYEITDAQPPLKNAPYGVVCGYVKRDYQIIGVYGEEFFILLNRDGSTGYAPQDQFFPGNG